MRPPFTLHEFFAVFARYNEAVWPMQPVLVVLAVATLVLVYVGGDKASPSPASILAFLWAWMAIQYHFAQFALVNPAARVFGALFLIQAALFLWFGAITTHTEFEGYPRQLSDRTPFRASWNVVILVETISCWVRDGGGGSSVSGFVSNVRPV